MFLFFAFFAIFAIFAGALSEHRGTMERGA